MIPDHLKRMKLGKQRIPVSEHTVRHQIAARDYNPHNTLTKNSGKIDRRSESEQMRGLLQFYG